MQWCSSDHPILITFAVDITTVYFHNFSFDAVRSGATIRANLRCSAHAASSRLVAIIGMADALEYEQKLGQVERALFTAKVRALLLSPLLVPSLCQIACELLLLAVPARHVNSLERASTARKLIGFSVIMVESLA